MRFVLISMFLFPLTSLAEEVVPSSSPAFGAYARVGSLFVQDEAFQLVADNGVLTRFEFGGEYLFSSPARGLGVQLGLAVGARGSEAFNTYDTGAAVTGVDHAT